MERNAEIKFSLMILISFFLHLVFIIGLFSPHIDELARTQTLREKTFGGRDIIVNINQDDKQVVTEKTLLSERSSSAKGRLTREKGDNWLNNSRDFTFKRGARRTSVVSRSALDLSEKTHFLLDDRSEYVITMLPYDPGVFEGEEGEFDFTRIPDRNGFTRKNAIFYTSDGRFSFNTLKFKHFEYFRKMKDKIASNWYPPPLANSVIYGYAPGRTRIMAILNQEVKLYFTMNRKGDVLRVVIVESMGNMYLDPSCVEAVANSKNFGPVPGDITGNVIVIPFVFMYIVY